MTSAKTETMHPFEKASLGKAPFRFVGFEYKVGPLLVNSSAGVETWVGSPGQPMGTCAYCSNGIAECCIIKSADGKVFMVGNVCVYKTGDQRLASSTKKAINEHRREKKAKRDQERIDAARERLDDVRTALGTQPHPDKWLADEGKTALDYVEWMFCRAGRTGMVKAARVVEAAVAKTKEVE